MQSMTGYGHGEASNKSVSIIVELRSVNARFRDVHVRLPRYYLFWNLAKPGSRKDYRGRVEVMCAERPQMAPSRFLPIHRSQSSTFKPHKNSKRLLRDPTEIPLTFILQQPVLTSSEPEPDVISEWILSPQR